MAVDSEPRGATVTLAGETAPAGTTPFYLRMQRVPSDQMQFGLGRKRTAVDVDCKVRWSLELIGNGVLALLSPEAAVVGVAIDLATGAAFECPETILATLNSREPGATRHCRRYIVAPPPHIDSSYSDAIEATWRERAQKALTGCDDFVDQVLAEDVFDVLGISHRDPLSIEGMDAERLHYLGHETGATHLVVLNYVTVGDQIRFEPAVYDLYRGASVDVPGFNVATDGGAKFEVRGGSWLALWTFSAFPNSISYGYNGSNLNVEPKSSWQVDGTKERSSQVADAISRISLTSVEHPQAYSTWDYGFSFFPSLELFSMAETLSLHSDAGVPMKRDVGVNFLAPLYHAGITGHTVVGAFAAGVAAGGYLARMKIDGDPATFTTGLMTGIDLSYTAFLTQTLFFQASTTTYRVASARTYADDLTLKNNFSAVEARVGYYMPRMKRLIRSLRKAPVP